MSDSYDDYEAKIQLAEHAWEEHVVKTEHDRAVELGKAYERGWNAALAQQEPVAWRFRSGTWFNREVQWRYIDTLDGAEGLRGLQPLYTAPPKKEWVGLTVDEARKFYEKYTNREELIYAIDKFLEEKNHG